MYCQTSRCLSPVPSFAASVAISFTPGTDTFGGSWTGPGNRSEFGRNGPNKVSRDSRPKFAACLMAQEASDRWHQARDRRFQPFTGEESATGGSDFEFGIVADPQLGMLGGESDWQEEIRICSEGVDMLNRCAPRFVVILGDLTHHHPDIYEGTAEVMRRQVDDFKNVFGRLSESIPIVCVSGNHDVGDAPTPSALKKYKEQYGDDYFMFHVNGVRFIICNTSLYNDPSNAEEEYKAHEKWLAEVLSTKHDPTIILGHHPWFLYNEDEKDDLPGFSYFRGEECPDSYFHIKTARRKPVLKLFEKGGVKAIFAGHWHQNKCSKTNAGTEMVITSALGGQLGNDAPGIRLVSVSPAKNEISHRYIPTHRLKVTKK